MEHLKLPKYAESIINKSTILKIKFHATILILQNYPLSSGTFNIPKFYDYSNIDALQPATHHDVIQSFALSLALLHIPPAIINHPSKKEAY